MHDSGFLDYKPTMIAACATIISINIYMKDLESYKQIGAFEKGADKGP